MSALLSNTFLLTAAKKGCWDSWKVSLNEDNCSYAISMHRLFFKHRISDLKLCFSPLDLIQLSAS